MEFLEMQDPERKKLLETSDRHRREIEKEVSALSDRTEKVLKNALIIGGTLALTYLAVSQLSSSKTKKKKVKSKPKAVETEEDYEEEEVIAGGLQNSLLSQIGTKIVNTATLVLLDLAKEKLSEFLQSQKKQDENS
jgi:hypothetical protein